MTGDTAKGRSISVVRRLFPRNRNFAMAQAAAIPNTTLAGTTIATVRSVSRIAARASGSRMVARKKAPPLERASANTTTSGRTRKKARKASAIPVSAQRAHAGSLVARGRTVRGRRVGKGAMEAGAIGGWFGGGGWVRVGELRLGAGAARPTGIHVIWRGTVGSTSGGG